MKNSAAFVEVLTNMVSAFGDKYDRNARLKPALLMLLPALVAIVMLYHDAHWDAGHYRHSSRRLRIAASSRGFRSNPRRRS